MPTSAYGLLILGLFGIAWLLIAWRSHLTLQSRPAAAPKVPRLLKPRTPLDCPACCPSVPYPTLPAPVCVPVRPWREIKSRRGAPKRIPTQGFACPMPTCPYYQITDAHVHAPSRRRLTRHRRTHSDLSLPGLPLDLAVLQKETSSGSAPSSMICNTAQKRISLGKDEFFIVQGGIHERAVTQT